MNPVLREGNSDRRAPASVKGYARKHPHSMGAWSPDSKTHVATMGDGDFRHNEKSVTFAAATSCASSYVAADGTVTVLKESIPVLAGEIVDATFMSAAALDAFLAEQMADAKAKGVLFSIHLKATMMKVSDPIIFGHAVKTYFADVFAKYGDDLDRRRRRPQRRARPTCSPRSARCPTTSAPPSRPRSPRRSTTGPALAMVDSDRGITNLHVPSDVIIDASMPPMIRTPGRCGTPRASCRTPRPSSPTRRYAGVYAETVIDDCRDARRVRPGHDGLGAQRRAHGAEGRGVRLPRQDLRDRRRRAPCGSSTAAGDGAAASTTSRRATSGGPARPRTPRSATG